MRLDPDLKELLAQLLKAQAKTEIQLAATDAQLAATDKRLEKRLDKIGKMVGGISNNQGDIAEEFFANTIGHTKLVGGIQYDLMDTNITREFKGIKDEYDIVLVNGKHVAIIETKYKAHENDLEKLVTKKQENFKKLYPEYANYEHYLGLAPFHINEALRTKALALGVMVLQRKGDLVEAICP